MDEKDAPVPGVLRSEAPNIARALADLGLLADPAQTTELEGVVDVPVGSTAYRLINEQTAQLEDLRQHARNVAAQRDVEHAAFVDAANDRDRLSLLLRGMARKLVATRSERVTLERILSKERRRVDTALQLIHVFTATGPHFLSPDETRAVRAALVGDQPKAEEPRRAPCPEGYHFVGQPLTHCSECGLPPWYHAGMSTLEDNSDPFGSGGFKLRPWTPGEREALRAKWEPVLSGVALRDVEEADDAAGDRT